MCSIILWFEWAATILSSRPAQAQPAGAVTVQDAAGHRAATRSVLEGHEHAGTLTQIEMSGTGMDANTVLALGLGVTPPWRLINQRLETGKQPHELLGGCRRPQQTFPCPVFGEPSKAYDFAEFTWRHRNCFQHHC